MAIAKTIYIDKSSDKFLLDAYNGTGGFKFGYYLVPHGREDEDDFKTRQTLAIYPNYCRKLVGVLMGFLTKDAPSREDMSDLYAQFVSNADGQGKELDAVLFVYQRLAMILGTVYIIVDKPTTQGDTKATEAMPYLAMRKRNQLVHECKDACGVWDSVTFCEEVSGKTQYRTFTKTGWQITEHENGSGVLSQGTYNLGEVPVVPLHIAEPLEPTDSECTSFYYDIAQRVWELYNVLSEMRDQERQQAFAILTMPYTDPSELEKLKDITIGTKNGLPYNANGGGQPAFIAPPPDPLQHFTARIESIKADIFSLASLEFIGNVQPSGEALSWHFTQTNSALNSMAKGFENAENHICRLVHKWQGQTPQGKISYPNNFNIADVKKALEIAMDSINLNLGPVFNRTVKKLAARQVLQNDVSAQTLADIEADIDANGDIYGDRLQQQAGL